MKNKKITNFKTIDDYVRLTHLIIQYYHVNTIVNYKENGQSTPFYGSFKNYKHKKLSLTKTIFTNVDNQNNKVFNDRFKIHTLIFNKYFGTTTINHKQQRLWPIIYKQIVSDNNSPIIIYNKITKNKKTDTIDKITGKNIYINVFEASRRYIIKDEVLSQLFTDTNVINKIIDLNSDYYTDDERIAIKTFIKLRKEFSNKTKTFKQEQPNMKKTTKYDDIIEDDEPIIKPIKKFKYPPKQKKGLIEIDLTNALIDAIVEDREDEFIDAIEI